MAKKLTKKPARPRPLREGDEGFDSTAAAELAACRKRIETLHTRSAIDLWHEGNEFLIIRDKKLFRQDGYGSMRLWLNEVCRRPARTVSRRMAFANDISLSDLRKFEPDALDLALEYVALSRGDEGAWNPRTLVIDVPRAGDRVEKVPFRRIEIGDLEQAVKHQRQLAERRRADRIDGEDKELQRFLTESVVTETGALATVDARPSKTGLHSDTLLKLSFRAGDLAEVVERLQYALAQKAKKPPRGRG